MAENRRIEKLFSIRDILKDSLPILISVAVVGALAGFILESFEAALAANPVIFLLIPPVIGLGGSLGGIIDSHLGTALDLEIVKMQISDPVLVVNVLGGFTSSITVFTLLGIILHFLSLALGAPSPGLIQVFLITFATGVLLTIITIILAIFSAFIGEYLGETADDFALPIVTVLIDLIGILVLFYVSSFFL